MIQLTRLDYATSLEDKLTWGDWSKSWDRNALDQTKAKDKHKQNLSQVNRDDDDA